MQYADRFCKIRDDYAGHYIVTGEDLFTGTKVEVKIPSQALFAYRQGKLIHDAMPMLSDKEREFLISGMYDSFDEMIGEDE